MKIDTTRAELTEVNIGDEKKISIKNILGKILYTQTGEEVGIVENVEIDQNRKIKLIVRDNKHLSSPKDTIQIPISYITVDSDNNAIILNLHIDKIKRIL